ncbi:MAG: c-type cytochrome [Candidatus Rokubacteria bacterium]|nr:c-type cytochrome [Candidatus Rokubacteria bacterium]
MRRRAVVAAALLALGAVSLVSAQGASRHISMEALHRSGGVPPGWRFTLPAGDAARGRALFASLECYRCHEIAGAGFPAPGGDATHTGPALTGMGGHHPPEYFAESIIDPNAVIVDGPGFTGPDGRSIMPSYADSLSVAQLQDLVAYLTSLTQAPAAGTGGAHQLSAAGQGAGDAAAGHQHHHPAGAERTQTAGPYDLRLVYDDDVRRLMLFVTDSDSGEAVPYLPVTASVETAAGTRSVRLAPGTGPDGFHYGAAVRVPDGTKRVAIGIGPAAMQALEPLKGRYSRGVTARFDWTADR